MDAFDLLGLPRRPLLAPADVRAAFQNQARARHPDAAGGDAEAFAELNEASAILSHPARRLRLLLGDAAAAGGISDTDLFLRVGALVQAARRWQIRRDAKSPLERALAASEAAKIRQELEDMIGLVAAAMENADGQLIALDRAWPEVSPADLSALAARFDRLLLWKRQLAELQLAP